MWIDIYNAKLETLHNYEKQLKECEEMIKKTRSQRRIQYVRKAKILTRAVNDCYEELRGMKPYVELEQGNNNI